METKTPNYTRKAIDKYNAKFFRATVTFPKEYKDILTAENTELSVSAYVNQLVHADLIKRGLLPADDISVAADEDMPFS